MNFEELYIKYKNGTATDEESAFVEYEIEKARIVDRVLEKNINTEDNIINPADEKTVLKAKKAFNLRHTIKTVIITVISITVIASIALGIIFGTAYISANSSKAITKEEAIESATQLIKEHTNSDEIIVNENELELDIGTKLTDSVYIYEIDIISGDYSYTVEVSAKTGYAVITDKMPLLKSNRNNSNQKNYH